MNKNIKHMAFLGTAILSLSLILGGCASHSKIKTHPKKIQTTKQSALLSQKDINATANQVGGFGNNTTGGSKATKNHTYEVTNGKELQDALHKNTKKQPRKIIIKGRIDVSEDKDGNHLNQLSYIKRAKKTDYNLPDYLRAFNPKAKPAARNNRSHMEKARQHVAKYQNKQIKLYVPANTTIIGATNNKVIGPEFDIKQSNVIIRNLNIESPTDEFPKWDEKNHQWKARYSTIKTNGANNVWIDHNSMTDKPRISGRIKHLNQPYHQHRYFIDASHGANNMTVSNNDFSNHRSVAIIDSKGKHTSKATFAHNRFIDTSAQMPKVKNGQVDILSNLYAGDTSKPYIFDKAWELDKGAHVFAQNNDFMLNSKNMYGKYVATAQKGSYFTDKDMRKNNSKAKALTKKGSKNPQPQASFNHIIKAMQHGFGANLK